MIQLKVDPYCKNCSHFSPQAIRDDFQILGQAPQIETTVVCEHATQCATMVEYLKSEEQKP